MKPNLQQLIKKLKLNYCNSSIIESNFPTISKGKVTKIFEFESSYTTQEAKEKLKNEGYRPATPRELLNWAKDNWNGKDNVVALGQEWLDACGDPRVVCLWGRAGLRELGLFWAGGRWNSNTRVAGIKLDTLVPDKPHSTPQEDWEKEFEALWTLPNDWTASKDEPVYNLDKRKKEIKSFIHSLLTSRDNELKDRDTKLLKAIANLVESDAGFESDCVALDIINKRPVSEREKTLAELTSSIYKIVHPRFSTCSHPEWEKETDKLLSLLDKDHKKI